MKSVVYCDHNATSPLRSEAKAVMIEAMENVGNPSSIHAFGRAAHACLEESREQIAHAIGACREDVTFTSGGTEANSAVLNGARLYEPMLRPIVGGIEHDAVLAQLPEAIIAPVTPNGVIDLAWLETRLQDWPDDGRIPFLSLMIANNETGVIQPVEEAANLIHEYGGLVHCDAIQGVGKIPFSVIDGDLDYVTLSSHKVGGPAGIGAFYVRPNAPFRATLLGGGQELGKRSGTQNLLGAVGFAKALEIALADLSKFQSLSKIRDKMEADIMSCANVSVFGDKVSRLPNTSCFGIEGLTAETLVMAMDLAGVAVSAGSACSSGKVKSSHVLKAMGVEESLAKSAIRVSFGWNTEEADYLKVVSAWKMAAQRKGGILNVPQEEKA